MVFDGLPFGWAPSRYPIASRLLGRDSVGRNRHWRLAPRIEMIGRGRSLVSNVLPNAG